MRLKNVIVFTAGVLLMAPAIASAQTASEPPTTITVRAGQPSMINYYYSLNRDCSSRGPVEVTLSEPPSHGQASADEGRMKPRFARGDGMAACNRRRVPATRVFYEPDPDAVEDSFTLSLTFPNGETAQEAYQVTVR